MTLSRVPGSKSYMADSNGFRSILADPKVGAVALSAAESLASAAGRNYEAASSSVAGGWANEARAGAVVREVSRSARDARGRALLSVVEAMSRRSA